MEKSIITMQQVHGSRVVAVSKRNIGRVVKKCDGLITNDPKVILRVSVADCLPVSLYDPSTNSIGLVHAGWRGLEKNIIANAVALMGKTFSSDPKNIRAEIGPHICWKHYEVGKDVAEKFVPHKGAIKTKEGKTYLDIGKAGVFQLLKSGISKSKIKCSKRCTFEDERLPSYRRASREKRQHYFMSVGRPYLTDISF